MTFRIFSSLILLIVIMDSCRKDQSLLKGPGTLGFSEDTVYFDTVFTRLKGSMYPRSINKRFMIRNPYKESVNINVRLMGGKASEFRINVDGLSGDFIPDVEILPKDSAWVFVEATLEPNNSIDPLVRDSIEFETNGNRQYIQLAAYGWDAYYLKDSVFTGTTSLILKDKPYVIVNSVFVDVGAKLTIGPGLHFYSTPNSVLQTGGTFINISSLNILGTLEINGTKTEPVIFEGDRLDNRFKDKSGQWQGIHFYRKSINNKMTHAIIKNATIGVRVDSLPENGKPNFNLVMKNCIVKNMSGYGILGLTARVRVENTLVYNCGINTFGGYYGGDYQLEFCTFYTGANGRKNPHVVFNNVRRDANNVILEKYALKFSLLNNIIYGSLDDELGIIDPYAPLFDTIIFQSNVVKMKNQVLGTGFKNIFNKDPQFVEQPLGNFKLKSISPAIDTATVTGVFIDLEEKSRGIKPDIGAYEY